MEQKRITPITTAGCFAGIMVILALLSTYVPFFSFIGFFIMPIPMTIIFVKYGMRQAILLGIVAGVLMGIFIDPLTAIVQMLTFGAVGIALGLGFTKQWAPAKMLLGVTAALIGTAAIFAALVYAVMDVNLVTLFTETFDTIAEQVLQQYKDTGMSAIELAETKAQLEEVRRILPTMLPMLMCLAMAIIAYVNVKVCQFFLRRLGFNVTPFLPIRYWEMPRGVIYLYILALAMKYWGATRSIDWLMIIGVNLNQMAFFFVCIQGLAFLFYVLDRRFHIGSGLQAVIIALFFCMPVCSYAAFILGIVDMIANIRKKQGMT